ncbi:MAG: thioredoxin domain-containing protein [Candidatus Moranbacteria bacterium]|nr:thioredoxin domain-containing protein [Candidatus Moranbacteria bacterium]
MEEKNEEKSAQYLPMEKGEGKRDSQCADESCRRKIKNYTSMLILLAGLLIGSVFVDVAQFFGQQGVSPRVLKNIDVFPLDGRTWVAFNEPVVNLQVLTDSKCEACDPTEPLKWLKRVIPTTLAKKVEIDSPEGKALAEKFNVKSLPAFIFDESVTKTDVYAQAQDIFENKDNSYLMNTEQVGIKAGKYLETPSVSQDDPQIGPADAKVKVVLFSDFQCPYCKTFNDSFEKAINNYKDKVLFVYKFLPLSIHPQSQNAAMAGACANDQGKFWEMSSKLYSSQDTWGKTTGTASFKSAAVSLGLNSTKFNQCMDSNQFKDKIDADTQMASSFGISGTPAFFVDDQFFGGVVSYDEMKKTIDEELAK